MAISWYLLLAASGFGFVWLIYSAVLFWRKYRASASNSSANNLSKTPKPNDDGLTKTASIAEPPQRWWQSTKTDVIGTIAFALLAASVSSESPVLFTNDTPAWLSPGILVLLFQIVSVLQVAPLAFRRRYPVGAAITVAIISAIHAFILIFPLVMVSDIAVLVALYTVTAYGPKWAGKTGLAVALLGTIGIGWRLVDMRTVQFADTVGGIIFTLALMALVFAAWALGLMRRAQVASIGAVIDKAAALSELSDVLTERNVALVQRNEALDVHAVNLEFRARQLEIERDQQAQIATAAERARIAREMHDIVGHAIANIIVYANGARVAAAQNPQVAVDALAAIAETGTEALATTKQLLGLLRAPDQEVETRPEPGNIGRAVTEPDPIGIHGLIDEVRQAGTEVNLAESGEPRQLSPGATNTFYRVCQEALTNARKYGVSDVPVEVRLDWQPTFLTLDVVNKAPKALHAGIREVQQQGYGLIGMRERAALISGHLTTGFNPDGDCWQVSLSAPISDRELMGGFERRTEPVEVTGLRPPQPPKIITAYDYHQNNAQDIAAIADSEFSDLQIEKAGT